MDTIAIDLFHNIFSPSGTQPEHRKLAHELLQPTAGCIAIFHKYCCYTKCGGITTNSALRNHWGYDTDVPKYHNAGSRQAAWGCPHLWDGSIIGDTSWQFKGINVYFIRAVLSVFNTGFTLLYSYPLKCDDHCILPNHFVYAKHYLCKHQYMHVIAMMSHKPHCIQITCNSTVSTTQCSS